VVLAGTSLTFAILFEGSDIAIYWQILITLGAFLATSFARMHLGYNYPSDCLLTLPLSVIVVALSLTLGLTEGAFGCNSCGNKDFSPCYGTLAQGDVLNIRNFDLS